jgi:ribosomal protein S18 acetylase RimI-like enzyme
VDGAIVDTVLVRRAAREDIEQIGKMWEKLVDYHVLLDARLPGSVHNGARRYARRLYGKLDDDYSRILVAEVDRQVVGYVIGMLVDLTPDLFLQEESGFLADIFVEPTYRQHGIGRQLVNALARWFRERGVQHFEWHVAASNTDALAFWREVGGEPLMIRMRADVAVEEA